MWRKQVIAAVVVCLIGISVAKADLILTVEGQNPTGIPLMMVGTGPYQVALDGNTTIEPNGVRVEAVGGTITVISDVNHQYSFQYDSGSAAGYVWLITNIDITLDGILVPANTTIYELFIFCNPDINLTGACGSDYSTLYPSEEGGQGDSITEETESQIMTGEGEMPLDNTIEISSDINTNTIWTASNTYHIASDINVQALLVIEPGTVVKFAQGTTMSVNNGGILISSGTPENPIKYTSEMSSEDYDYNCPLYIEETASDSTKITYSYIENAFVGIVLFNHRLDCPIENNYLYHNVYGIVEYGTKHTDIKNNLLYDIAFSSIEVFLASESGETDPNSYIAIYNNTCTHNQFVGICAHGVGDLNEFGWVDITNNILSESQAFGIELVDGNMWVSMYKDGFYNNAADTNDLDYLLDYPVYETMMPFVEGTGTLPCCYLRQDCNFINAGYGFIEETSLIGKTTDIAGQPDNYKVDIGFHYPNWNFTNAGDGNIVTMDLNGDLQVNFKDFAILASVWQTDPNINDLNTMADEWLKFAGPNIQIQIYGDSNDGYVNVGLNGLTSETMRNYLFVDGQYISEIASLQTNQTINLDISALGDGIHQLKAISLNTTDKIFCSNLSETSFSCAFNYCSFTGAYEQNEPYRFCGFYSGSDDVNVKVYDVNSTIVWSQTCIAQDINDFIPSSITLGDDLHRIILEPASTTAAAISKPLSVKFNPDKVPLEVRALIILPDSGLNELSQDIIGTVINTFKVRHVPYWKLELENATYKNLAWLAWNRNIQYIYFSGNGGYTDINNTFLRTWIQLSDKFVVSVKISDFQPGYAPPWCTQLPGLFERSLKSIFGLGFSSGAQLKYVYFDCCYSGRLKITGDNRLIEGPGGYDGIYAIPYSDMSYALGMLGATDQFYQGWWDYMWTGPGAPDNLFGIDEWTKLKERENLYDAIQYAIERTAWYPPGLAELALNNVRIYGLG